MKDDTTCYSNLLEYQCDLMAYQYWERLYQGIRRRIHPSTVALPEATGERSTETRAVGIGSPSDPVSGNSKQYGYKIICPISDN